MTPRVVTITIAIGLVAALLGCVLGIVWIAIANNAVSGVLENITIGTLGAVAGFLARTGSDAPKDNPPTEVTVVNPAADPVPVSDAG